MKKLFNISALAGLLLTTLELILKFSHSSICNSTGCILAESSLTIPDKVLIILGIITFLTLLVLSVFNKESLIDKILIVIFSLEGVLVGYQLFRLNNICYFCITVFSIFVFLAFLRVLQKRWLVLVGFASFLSVFLMFAVLKPLASSNLPKSNAILIYKTSCPHCERVERFIKARGLKIKRVNVTKCVSFLKSLGVEAVPALIIRGKDKIEILIGDNNIINFFYRHETTKPTINLLDNSTQLFKGSGGFCTINSEHCR